MTYSDRRLSAVNVSGYKRMLQGHYPCSTHDSGSGIPYVFAPCRYRQWLMPVLNMHGVVIEVWRVKTVLSLSYKYQQFWHSLYQCHNCHIYYFNVPAHVKFRESRSTNCRQCQVLLRDARNQRTGIVACSGNITLECVWKEFTSAVANDSQWDCISFTDGAKKWQISQWCEKWGQCLLASRSPRPMQPNAVPCAKQMINLFDYKPPPTHQLDTLPAAIGVLQEILFAIKEDEKSQKTVFFTIILLLILLNSFYLFPIS